MVGKKLGFKFKQRLNMSWSWVLKWIESEVPWVWEVKVEGGKDVDLFIQLDVPKGFGERRKTVTCQEGAMLVRRTDHLKRHYLTGSSGWKLEDRAEMWCQESQIQQVNRRPLDRKQEVRNQGSQEQVGKSRFLEVHGSG